MDFVRAPALAGTGPGSGSKDGGQAERKLSALELAKVLCKSFVSPPVHQLVMGDDEAGALKRVATVMSTEYSTTALPLKSFLTSAMKMPVMMHDSIVQCVKRFPGSMSI